MTCPMCACDTKIVVSRKDCDNVLRYRKCKKCNYSFSTIEVDEDIYNRREDKHIASNLQKIEKCIAAFQELTGKLTEFEQKYDKRFRK